MRVDVDGLKIDTTVNTADPSLMIYHTFTITPNPVRNNIGLSITLYNVIIRDIHGRAVMSLDQSNDFLDVSSLSVGAYIVIGQSKDKEWYRAKFVKS